MLTSDSVAIVGARDVSDEGVDITRQLASDLAGLGINIISGYASGVDSEAHLGALAATGTTTIVLPYGINQLSQKRSLKKFDWEQQILSVSQFAPDTRWHSYNAMVQSQLICTLAKAVVVIESGPERNAAGKYSGTFITGRAALAMNTLLFVLDPEHLITPPEGNAALIEAGGYPLNPVEGFRSIAERISEQT